MGAREGQQRDGWSTLRPATDEPPLRLPTTPFGRLAVAHGAAAAGDALVTLALSDSLFFSAGADAARGKVLLYLVLTLLPFTFLAPFIGPLVDRHADGRRWTMALASGLRAVACLMLVGRLGGLVLYPLAFVVLVASKSQAVARSSLVPAVVAHEDDIVPANSRLTVLAAVSSLVLLPGALARWIFGGNGVVALAALVFALAAAAATRIRMHGDPTAVRARRAVSEASNVSDAWKVSGASTASHRTDRARPSSTSDADDRHATDRRHDGDALGAALDLVDERGAADARAHTSPRALRAMFRDTQHRSLLLRLAVIAMSLLRANLGLLTFLVSFTFKRADAPAWQLGVVALAGILGQNVGAALATPLGRSLSERTILSAGLVAAALAAFGLSFSASRFATGVVAGVVGLASGAGRVAFDSIVQRNVAAHERSHAYARFETRFQLYWVMGALVPVLVSIPRSLGFALIAAISAFGAVVIVVGAPALDRLEDAGAQARARWRRPDVELDGER